jgi:hypothetical protein
MPKYARRHRWINGMPLSATSKQERSKFLARLGSFGLHETYRRIKSYKAPYQREAFEVFVTLAGKPDFIHIFYPPHWTPRVSGATYLKAGSFGWRGAGAWLGVICALSHYDPGADRGADCSRLERALAMFERFAAGPIATEDVALAARHCRLLEQFGRLP